MPILVNKYIIGRKFVGITLWPFIIIKDSRLKEDTSFVNHEEIHLVQQRELLVIPFYIWYTLEYIVRLIQYKNANEAYRNISFEREAYYNEDDLFYLKYRKAWSFIKYL